MALTPDQTKELKSQLSQQIQHLPPEQKAAAQQQIDSMSNEAIEEMLKQQQSETKVFRMIISGEIPSTKLDENDEAIAVLDNKPISEGHVVIIPKNPITEHNNVPKACFDLGQKIVAKIISKLKAKDVRIETESKFGEVIINLIPIYDKPLDLKSPRKEASQKDLEFIKEKLNKPEEKKEVIKPKKRSAEVIKLNRRVP